MDLDDIRALLSVIEHRSVQAASRATRTSRTSLRRRIDALEARVGVPLLVRDVAGAVPTPAGQAIAARGRALIEDAAALLTAVRSMDTAPEGLMRVLVPAGLPPHVVGVVFATTRARFPRLELRVSVCDDPLQELRDDVDLVVHFGAIPTSGSWISTTLARTPERLFASPTYLAEAGTPTTVEELANHVLLSWTPPGGDPHLWPRVEGPPFEVHPVFVCADVHLIRQFASAGHGIALVPDGKLPMSPDMFGELVPVLDGVVGRACALRAMMPESMAKLPKGRAVLDTCRELAAAAATL